LRIDLTERKTLNKNHSDLLSKINYNERENFNYFISKLEDAIETDIDWWVSGPISRNTLNSNLYQNFCKVELVKKLLNNGEIIDEIIVENYKIKETIKQLVKTENIKIHVKISRLSIVSNFVYKLLNVIYYFSILLIKHLLFNLFFKKNTINPKESIILIDKYVLPGYFSKDRYFTGLWELLNQSEKNIVYFLPTIVYTPISKIFSAFKKLNESDCQYIYKESYLKFRDLFFATFYPFRINNKKINPIIINDIDYSYLIKENINNVRSYGLEIEALITYRFIKRLKGKNVKLKTVIDWWENQALDKALHKALSQFYPNISVVGYLGYAPRELELQLYPTKFELHHNLIPKDIAVIGKGFVNGLKIFNGDHNIEYAPAFRFQHLWNSQPHLPEKDYYTILIALPIIFAESIHILNQVIFCIKDLSIKSFRLWVKPHPTMSVNKIKNALANNYDDLLEFIQTDTKDALRQCDILISGMSSICLESISLGIPVLVVDQKQGLKYKAIPNELDQDLWKQVSSSQDIIAGIEFYRKRSMKEQIRHAELGKKIRENYFEPVTRKGVLRLLRIERNSKN